MNRITEKCEEESHLQKQNDRLLAELCSAARNNDASSVAKSLGLRRRASPSIHSPLLQSGQNPIINTEDLLRADSFHLLFKALLMAPSAYDTPWLAALQVLSNLQNLCNNLSTGRQELVRITSFEIQTFIQQNVASWLVEERNQSETSVPRQVRPSGPDESLSELKPGDWMIQLAKCAMQPLFKAYRGGQTKEDSSILEILGWEPALGIISSLVVLTEHLDTSLYHSILDVVVCSVDISCLVPFLRLLVDLRCHLREKDWSFLLQQLESSLAGYPSPESSNDLPFFMECALKLITRLLVKFETPIVSSWRRILLQIMLSASENASTFDCVESAITSYVASLPAMVQRQFISALRIGDHPEEAKYPRWLKTCMLLQLADATSRSGSELVSHMLDRSLPPRSRVNSMPASKVCTSLIQDIFDLAESGSADGSKVNETDWKAIFRSFEYKGRGQFTGPCTPQTVLVNCIGSLVWDTMLAGRSNSANTAETRRMDSWVNCSVLVFSTYHSSHRNVMMAFATLTTIFCEFPAQQSKLKELLLRSFAQLNLCDEKAADLAVLYCLVLSKLSRRDSSSQPTTIQGVESIVSTPMTLSLFMDVVDSIVDLPSGREKLLCVARSHIDSLSCVNAYTPFSKMVSPSNLMKCGIHALVSLVSVRCWTDLEEDAWVLLSTFIVEDQPRYTVTHRTWVYEHIRRRVQSQFVSALSAEHLLRCCIARLLIFCDSSDDNTIRFVPERVYYFSKMNSDELARNEDMVGLLGLTMDLMHFLAVVSGHSEVKNTISVVYHELFREIDSKGADINPSSICSKLLSVVNNGQASIFAVAIACLVAIGLEKPHSICYPLKDSSCLSVGDLKKLIADAERVRLRYPCKIKWDEFALYGNTKIAPEIKHAAIHLRMQATDVLLDFIFGPRWKAARLSYQSEVVVQRLSAILTVKRQWKLEIRTTSFERPTMHCESVVNTCDYLLSLMLPSIDEIIQFECAVGEMDGVLAVVIDICELLQEAFEVVEDRLRSICLDNVRSLYFSLCDESKCSELVVRIEKTLSTKTTMHEHRQQLFCLNSVKHEDDIDDFVRYLRNLILGVIITSLQPSLKGPLYATGLPNSGISSRHSGTIYNLLASICNDMLSGLKGKSGGLTYELFDSFLDAAETLIKQLHTLEESPSALTGKQSSVRSFDSNEATSLLEEILRNTSFSQRNVHKKLFSLIAEHFPGLYRSTSRKKLCGEPVLLMVDPFFDHRTPFAATAFMQAVSVIQDSSSNEGQSIWKEDHLIEHEDDCSTCSGKPREYCSKTRKESVDKSSLDHQTTRVECSQLPTQEVVQIPNKKSCMWTLNSSLQAIAACIEDFRASFHNKTRVDKGSTLKQYISGRNVEMDGIFKALNYGLDTVNEKIGEMGNMYCVRAMLLPPNIKGKICCVLDGIFSVLTKSLKTIHELTRHVPGESEHGLTVMVVEAFSYLVSWLSFPSETLDIFHKVRRWRHLEIFHSNEEAKRSGLASSDTVIAIKLRKTEMHMDESEGMLHKVLQCIQHGRDRRTPKQDKLQSLLSKCIDCDLVQLLSDKSSQLAEGHVLIENQFGPAESEGNKKKRKITENMKRRLNKERRRRTLRSRNGVVDKWLQIDRVTGDEMLEDDAFADLEDFLVDG